MHPELASGARISPPAGMTLIQQPGRVSVVILLAVPSSRSNAWVVSLRKKKHDAEAASVPQPRRVFCRHGHFHSMEAPVFRS